MPRVVILGGINGAGKTTASRAVLQDVLRIPTFVNADAIARGLNGLNPGGGVVPRWPVDAGRNGSARRSPGRFRLRNDPFGPHVRPVAQQVALARVRDVPLLLLVEVAGIGDPTGRRPGQERGHFVPDADIRRRYARSVRNFIELYRPVADFWTVYDNTDGNRHLLAMGEYGEEAINNEDEWDAFLRSADDA